MADAGSRRPDRTRVAAGPRWAWLLPVLLAVGGCGRSEAPRAADQQYAGEYEQPADGTAGVDPVTQLAELQRGAPEDVVRLMLQWDTAGLRFEDPYEDLLTRLYCYIPEQNCRSDEPAWDFAVVVTGFTLDPVLETGDSAQFVATFDELGAVWPDHTQGPLGMPPETLSLKRMDGLWRVVGLGSQMPPHLSPNGLLHKYRGVQPDSAVLARWLEDQENNK